MNNEDLLDSLLGDLEEITESLIVEMLAKHSYMKRSELEEMRGKGFKFNRKRSSFCSAPEFNFNLDK